MRLARLLALLALPACSSVHAEEAPTDLHKPNIVFVPADDLGYGDVGCYNSEKRGRPVREAIVSHSVFGVFAIRQGPWKLIRETETSGGWVAPAGSGPKAGAPGQLYNLRDDPAEQKNLFAQRPEIVGRLTELLQRYQREGRSAPR